jgi:autotransporter strand-loop-strand O-heptosyltransferase
MKIINVTPGIIPIPPNGWGAVEKIIWEIHSNLLVAGHESKISYLDDMDGTEDIVHIHVANLANLAHARGIPYYFTMHDHHAYLYGKDSEVYKENLRAMQNSIQAFVPAKYLVDYFNGIPQYFSHGVNTEIFTYTEQHAIHKLLCVANNGYGHNPSEDRKGFGIAIESARRLGLPITIAGPSANKQYFEKNPPQYDKLTILYDVPEEELLHIYKTHTIFLHPSQLEAGHPNLTLLEAMSCGLPVVGTFETGNTLAGMQIVPAISDSVVSGIHTVIENYTTYSRAARQQAETLSWRSRVTELIHIYTQNTSHTMKDKLVHHYRTTKIAPRIVQPTITYNNINGMKAEITGAHSSQYAVSFINKSTGHTVYSTTIDTNHWASASPQYYVDWQVQIRDIKHNREFTYDLELTNQKVYIALDSKSLGDTLAWIPYVDEFRKKHNCKVSCSTFWNHLFTTEYPEIEFVEPGASVYDIIAMYCIGIFYKENGQFDENKHRVAPYTQPLQQIASDILGLDYTEIRPRVTSDTPRTDTKQVTIAVHSTAQAKYWNNPTGWDEVVGWLRDNGYTVKLLSQEGDGYMGNKNPIGAISHPPSSIESVIDELQKSTVFIGISSGLSWLSWSLGIPTVLISGFTPTTNEMQDCIRIQTPPNKCSGCWGRTKFDAGDWNWCPDQKNTPRQFECSRSITPEMVIKELQKVLNIA